jgi:hypothetical protein
MSRAYGFLLESIPMKIGAGMTFLEVALSYLRNFGEDKGERIWSSDIG